MAAWQATATVWPRGWLVPASPNVRPRYSRRSPSGCVTARSPIGSMSPCGPWKATSQPCCASSVPVTGPHWPKWVWSCAGRAAPTPPCLCRSPASSAGRPRRASSSRCSMRTVWSRSSAPLEWARPGSRCASPLSTPPRSRTVPGLPIWRRWVRSWSVTRLRGRWASYRSRDGHHATSCVRLPAGCAACCWWTTASTWSRKSPRSSPTCSPLPAGCGCSPRAANRSASRAANRSASLVRSAISCGRCPYPPHPRPPAPPPLETSMRYACSSIGRRPPHLASHSPTPSPRPSPRCANGSMGYRWRSSWPPPGCAATHRLSWWSTSTNASSCSQRAPVPLCRGTARCAARSTGAMNCSTTTSGRCSTGSVSFPPTSTTRPPKRWARSMIATAEP